MVAADLCATLGWEARRAEAVVARRADELLDIDAYEDRMSFELRVAEDIQQEIHDTFVDTSWPECSIHRRHPLWLRHMGGELLWCCTASQLPIVALGSLGAAR